MTDNTNSDKKPQGHNESGRVHGSVDGASKMKPVIVNRKPASTKKNK